MKFTELFDSKGKKRNYVLGDDGKEYFYYSQDGYIIREMTKEDIPKWYELMGYEKTGSAKMIDLAKVDCELEKQQDEVNANKTLVLIKNEEIIGEIFFNPFLDEITKAYILIRIFDESISKYRRKRAKIQELIGKMVEETRYYDEVWGPSEEDPESLVQLV